MNRLAFDFEWRDLPGMQDPAIRGTMADLVILVNDEPVTLILDGRANTTRKRVLVSLYSLAEWMAANWWPLLEENRTGGRGSDLEYASRHAFSCAGDGFAFPELLVAPEGEVVRLSWRPRGLERQLTTFLARGETYLPQEEVRQTLADFVEAVLARLEACEVPDTWLRREWEALQVLPCEEKSFCANAARLGMDPFCLPPGVPQAVVRIADGLPANLSEDLFRTVSCSSLDDAFGGVRQGLERIQSAALDQDLSRIRACVQPRWRDAPWKQGYGMARELRSELCLPDDVPIQMEAVLGPLPVIEAASRSPRGMAALVGSSDDSSLCCYTAKTNEAGQRFACARGLGLFLEGPDAMPALLSSAITQKQQRSRAFAAEFLAPAEFIRARLESPEVTPDDIEGIAQEFGVSDYVIRHQIENHNLGEIVDAA